jgi:hypothetical protein
VPREIGIRDGCSVTLRSAGRRSDSTVAEDLQGVSEEAICVLKGVSYIGSCLVARTSSPGSRRQIVSSHRSGGIEIHLAQFTHGDQQSKGSASRPASEMAVGFQVASRAPAGSVGKARLAGLSTHGSGLGRMGFQGVRM